MTENMKKTICGLNLKNDECGRNDGKCENCYYNVSDLKFPRVFSVKDLIEILKSKPQDYQVIVKIKDVNEHGERYMLAEIDPIVKDRDDLRAIEICGTAFEDF